MLLYFCLEIYIGVFKVANYGSDVKIKKFKIADSKWLIEMQNFRCKIWLEMGTGGFLTSLITNSM